ncbi:MAG: carotenoid 1,2-hydratase [Acidobacteria bacterium]|nr:carotenoid 1,2-hydratase [Acidobacteriota bacterium]
MNAAGRNTANPAHLVRSDNILEDLDQETKDSIARALWLPSFQPDQIPQEILDRLASEKNSNKSFGERMRYRLQELIDHPESFTPDYRNFYNFLARHTDSLSPLQAYSMNTFLGADATRGYEEVPEKADFKFPETNVTNLRSQVGWYFFVGSAIGSNGKEYGIELMFLRTSLLPAPIAQHFGLSDLENQLVDIQFAISEANNRHYQAEPIVIAGTTGLIEYGTDRVLARIGRDLIMQLGTDSLFPLQIQARGIDLGINPPVDLEIDLTFTSSKGYLIQGADGCMPCCAGVGTLYYSVPNLKLDPARSRLKLKGEEVQVVDGSFWMDHQWGLTNGGARRESVRAANNLVEPGPGGWDWFMAQFDGDRQMTMSALHNNENRKYYFQTGPRPPEAMTVAVAGKFMDKENMTRDTKGTLTVFDWIAAVDTPKPGKFPPTRGWYPNRWHFQFGPEVPEDIREFTMIPIVQTGQSLFFGHGGQYSEGAVNMFNKAGLFVGRGFAESVHYIKTAEITARLAGLPVNATVAMYNGIGRREPGLELESLLYLLDPVHQEELKQITGRCKVFPSGGATLGGRQEW